MDNVVDLPVVTRLDMPVEKVLRRVAEQDLAAVIVVGETADGEFYFASSRADGPAVLWELERAKLALLNQGGAMPTD